MGADQLIAGAEGVDGNSAISVALRCSRSAALGAQPLAVAASYTINFRTLRREDLRSQLAVLGRYPVHADLQNHGWTFEYLASVQLNLKRQPSLGMGIGDKIARFQWQSE